MSYFQFKFKTIYTQLDDWRVASNTLSVKVLEVAGYAVGSITQKKQALPTETVTSSLMVLVHFLEPEPGWVFLAASHCTYNWGLYTPCG